MKKFIIFLLSIIAFNALGAARISINVPAQTIQQGSLQRSTLLIDPEIVQILPLHKMQGDPAGLGGVVFLHKVSSLIRSGDHFEAEATIVFMKKPESNPVLFKHANQDIELGWSNLEIIPTKAENGFLFGSFEIPLPINFLKWFLGLALLGGIGIGFWRGILVYRRKKDQTRKLRELKDELISASSYDDVVVLWQKKAIFLKSFPHISTSLEELERTLFQYQFKQRQTETEKSEVMAAYRAFLNKIQGGFNGI